MPIGPGKYDSEVQRLFVDTGASSVVAIVLDGRRGDGFSIVCHPASPMCHRRTQAELLRQLADKIDRIEEGDRE